MDEWKAKQNTAATKAVAESYTSDDFEDSSLASSALTNSAALSSSASHNRVDKVAPAKPAQPPLNRIEESVDEHDYSTVVKEHSYKRMIEN